MLKPNATVLCACGREFTPDICSRGTGRTHCRHCRRDIAERAARTRNRKERERVEAYHAERRAKETSEQVLRELHWATQELQRAEAKVAAIMERLAAARAREGGDGTFGEIASA